MSHLFVNPKALSLSQLQVFFKELPLASHPDLYEIRPEKSIGIGDIRALIQYLTLPPLKLTYKFVLIHSFHLATPEAQNALLKTLEEPPAYSRIILTAGSISPLLPTILSRCFLHFLPETSPSPHVTEPIDFHAQLPQLTPASRLAKLSPYLYKHDSALIFIESALAYDRHHYLVNADQAALENLKLTESVYSRLKQNVNPALCLGHYAFNLHA